MHLPRDSNLKVINMSMLFLSLAISKACCLILTDFPPSCTSSLASDTFSSPAASACSFPWSPDPVYFFPMQVLISSLFCVVCLLQSPAHRVTPMEKVGKSRESSVSPFFSPALWLTHVTSSHSPCLLLSLMSLMAIRAVWATAQWPSFRRSDHVGLSRSRAVYLIF